VIPAGADLKELERRRDRLPGDVRVVKSGNLGAIVGDAPGNDAKATRDQALAHARVLEMAVLDAPVVPFRFGTVVDGAVDTELLEARHDELTQLLESIRDDVQMTLKASYRDDVVMREIVEGHPKIAQLREQTRRGDEVVTRDLRLRLGELVSIALEQLRQHDAEAILDRLRPFVVSSAVEALESEYMVLNAPFLMERRRMHEFEEAAGIVAEDQAERMRFTLHGPMPAFDFINGDQLPWA
jgi:Gas vesicle synthesis protein GvpL/GvpF